MGIKVFSAFDGISCGAVALGNAGIKIDRYIASEIDKYAINVSIRNHPKIEQRGSITELNNYRFANEIQKFDLFMGGSPCQDLSALKTMGFGLDGEKSRLLYDFVSLYKKTDCKYFLLENVVPAKKEWENQIDDIMGVKGVHINSDLFVPQNRPRVYWTNIPIEDLPKRPDWNQTFYQYRRTYFRKNMSGVCPCLTANMGTGGHNVPLHSENLKDKLTPEECEALQGLPHGYTSGVSNARRYHGIGNGWTVNVLSHIFKGIQLS